MNVQEIMVRDVATCNPGTNLAEAASLMWRYDCGLLPVVDSDNRVLGTITDRDICIAAGTRNVAPSEIRVGEVVSHDAHCCEPADDLANALEEMRRERVRRLPVTDDDGHLVGILSLTDVIKHASEAKHGQQPAVTYAGAVDTLKAITTPAQPMDAAGTNNAGIAGNEHPTSYNNITVGRRDFDE
ncbi:MAG TPA: CBS domain-containing protein [Candidatus Kapabacteria bacterium]|nr:CBS domain-containing protein [Candidatus Kapabacteria bacterium]